jgi:CMP-N-acetylneuraminic acid synthetase/mannose-6-phosphate isomerase-like protein (cupin superfamily)
MSKVIAMIPARMGSKRIPKKNIRLLNGKPLIQYAIDAVKDANCFDEIWINSESEIIEKLAVKSGVKFYKRPEKFSTDTASNDMWMEDFFTNVGGDIVIQVLPTSPFITPEEIREFVQEFVYNGLDTLISMVDVRIESVYKRTPINFDQKKETPPSQTLEPIKAYGCSLMGWRKSNYLENMKKFSAGYHGGDGKIGYFTLKGYSTIDIDNEEEFQLAESVARSMTTNKTYSIKYYDEEHSEVYVPTILSKDGVADSSYNLSNQMIVNMKDIIKNNSMDQSWCHRVINTENNSATLITQMPGEGNRRHYHPDWNEWWFIVEGEWDWEIDRKTYVVKKNDFVFIPKGVVHKITARGEKQATRLAISREDVIHAYPEGDHTNE